MKDTYERLMEAVREWCIKNDIHEVCFYCKENCKQQYTHWSGCMPPEIYCDKFKDELKRVK